MAVVNGSEPARLRGLGGGGRSQDADGAAFSAFARLLGATPVEVSARVANDGDASATQMFDAHVDDAHERRRDALQEDYANGFGSPDGGRLDRTSVGARLAAGVDDAPQHKLGTGITDAVPVHRADHSTRSANVPPPQGGEQYGRSLTAEQPGPSVQNEGVPRYAAVDAKALDAPISIEVANSPVHGATASGAVAVTGGATTQNLAQQTAGVLASPRGADVDSGRAITSTQTPADNRSSTNTRRSPDPAPAGQRGTANSSVESADKSETSERTRFERLVQSMRLNMGTRRSTARLRLHPPELGRIRVDVRIVDDKVRIGVQTETDQARELLAGRASHLKAALERQGIHVDHFEVVTNTADPAAGDSLAEEGFGASGDAERNQDRHGASAADSWRAEGWEDDRDAMAESIGGSQVIAAGDTRLDIRI